MLTNEVRKKIFVGLLIGGLILGLIFLIFALFINRGTLTVIAKAPYSITISQLKTVSCPNDLCSTVIAPGEYPVTVKKKGYKDVQKTVTVPIGGEGKEEITFEFIPFIRELTSDTDKNIFLEPDVEIIKKELSTLNPSFEEKYVIYLRRNTENHRQTLYMRSIDGKTLGPETMVTSFIRDLKSYQLIPFIATQNKIAVIDNTDDGSTLYVIDLKNKVRTKIFTYPIIKDVQWLPGSEDFLFEARDSGELSESIFVYRATEQKAQKLSLQTPLKDVAVIDSDRLIAATMQYAGEKGNGTELEGQPVILSEWEATASATTSTNIKPSLKFIDFSMQSLESRLIKSDQTLTLPEQVKLSADKKSLYFVVREKMYELRLDE